MSETSIFATLYCEVETWTGAGMSTWETQLRKGVAELAVLATNLLRLRRPGCSNQGRPRCNGPTCGFARPLARQPELLDSQ